MNTDHGRKHPPKAAGEDWHCPKCGSLKWVAASLTGPVAYGGRATEQRNQARAERDAALARIEAALRLVNKIRSQRRTGIADDNWDVIARALAGGGDNDPA